MIKLFVFDLGNVIVPFDHRQIATKLRDRSKLRGDITREEVFSYLFDWDSGLVNLYETGKMSSVDFFDALKERYELDLTFQGFKDIWNPIFEHDLEVNEAIRYIKGKGYPIFLLSNTNELHFSYIREEYPIVHELDEWILSFEVGVKKPEKRIYDAIFEKTEAAPEEVFYIDDIYRYVDAAREYGIRGLVFREARQLWSLLREEGI